AVPAVPAVPETAARATVDRSVSGAGRPLPFSDSFDFFRGGEDSASPLSEAPVCSDVPSDLERREERRSRFTRVVGSVVVTLGLGTLLAMSLHAPPAVEAPSELPVAAAPTALPADAPALLPSPVPAETAPIAAAPTAPAPVSSHRSAPLRRRAAPATRSTVRTQVPSSTTTKPSTIAHDRPPPTARFDD
ncbi:MAG TPA: hypothetical protein VEQ59_14210, partial [Polyangiaceae bacterium]|nr:hypothetical protein [Polyangiaceae bacterium]